MRPVFGQDRDIEAALAFAHLPSKTPRPSLSVRGNPMVALMGPGPVGRRCGDCRFIFVKHDHGKRRYLGCEKRGSPTAGPGTDHLSGWPVCALFEATP